jgi:hypothetical protein
MPDYRPGAPSVDLFTAGEHLVRWDGFGVDYPRSERCAQRRLEPWTNNALGFSWTSGYRRKP